MYYSALCCMKITSLLFWVISLERRLTLLILMIHSHASFPLLMYIKSYKWNLLLQRHPTIWMKTYGRHVHGYFICHQSLFKQKPWYVEWHVPKTVEPSLCYSHWLQRSAFAPCLCGSALPSLLGCEIFMGVALWNRRALRSLHFMSYDVNWISVELGFLVYSSSLHMKQSPLKKWN